MMKWLPIAMPMSLSFVSCGGVKPSDLTGTWIITDKSRQQFLSALEQKAVAKITLEPNGTFAASEIPEDLLYGPPHSGMGLVTGNGVWKLISRGGKEQVQLNFEAITEGQCGALPYGTQLDVSKGFQQVSLFYFQGGDADQGRRIEFERSNRTSGAGTQVQYIPQAGRFLAEYPLGFGGGINKCPYAGNLPVNWMDPSGLALSSTEYLDLLKHIQRGAEILQGVSRFL
jgi:RHS repeat-associated protein